ncbi:MAG TPA: formate dehydrogenase subunit delta [Xanthobacteraceae bacterium]|nr:formate dehydrogenase subunit delta [Xanthobacteraceae bacterium]
MSPEKLVYMANQIGKFFASQGSQKAVAGAADHIKKFWDPRMRAAIAAYIDDGWSGLEPHVRLAIVQLHDAAATKYKANGGI